MDRTPDQSKSGGKASTQSGASSSESFAAQSPGPESSIEPTDVEVEAWAERVRRRRQAWVDGPTEEEKHEWLRRERIRRAMRLDLEVEAGPESGGRKYDPHEERRRLQQRYLREVRLATEGLGVWMATLPFRAIAELVTTGREWEDETLRPARRRWVPFYEDEM